MASVYAARLRNAHRIGRNLKRMLSKGFIVFDEEGARVTSVSYRIWGDGIGLSIDGVVYMDSDPSFDNGMHTTVAEFNKQFDGWKAVHPSQIAPIRAA